MKLSPVKQDAARAFIFTHGRPLERSLYAFHFEEKSPDRVISELTKFQNPDGGFGHALEPDFRVPDSSALATSIALQVMRETKTNTNNPVLQKAIAYLLDVFDPEHHLWPIIPAHDNTAPHAPWWTYDADKISQWNAQRANPGAEIVAHLHHYKDLVPAGFLKECTGFMITHLDSLPDAMEMHDLKCYVWLANVISLPGENRKHLVEKLKRAITCVVARKPSQWDQYGLKPLNIADSPESPFAALLSEEIQRNLDYEIERQREDGSWAPNWSWGGAFPEAWQKAEKEWAGMLTLKTLLTLRQFDRLDPA